MNNIDPNTGKPKTSPKNFIWIIFGVIVGIQVLGGVITAITNGEPSAIWAVLSGIPVWIVIIAIISSFTGKAKTKESKKIQQSKKTINQMESLLKGNQFGVIKNLILGGKAEFLGKFLGQEKWSEIKKFVEKGQYQEITRILNDKSETKSTSTPTSTSKEPRSESKQPTPPAIPLIPNTPQYHNPSVKGDTLRIVLFVAFILIMAGVGIAFFVTNQG